MRTVLAHVLYVAVHAFLELPVGTNFRALLFREVREWTALADTVTTLDLGEAFSIQGCLTVKVVRLRWLEGIWALCRLQILDLATYSASAGHYLFDLSVANHACILHCRILEVKLALVTL